MPEAAPADLPQGEALLAALRGLPVPEGASTLFTVTTDEGHEVTLSTTGFQFVQTMLEGVDADLLAPSGTLFGIKLDPNAPLLEGLRYNAEAESIEMLRQPSAEAYEVVVPAHEVDGTLVPFDVAAELERRGLVTTFVIPNFGADEESEDK
jgi:hypothetical protein